MSDLRQLMVHATHYLAGRAGLMLLGFLSFPVLTRLLPVTQYGELSLSLKLCLFWTVLSKCGLQNAALRFFPEHSQRSAEEKRNCASTLVLLVAAISVLMLLIAFATMRLTGVHSISAVAYLAPLLLLLSSVRSVQPVFSGLLRSERKTWLFNLSEISGKAFGIFLSIAAMVLISVDLRFYLAGLLVAEILVLIVVGIWFYRNGLLRLKNFSPQLARSAFSFSFPLIAYELTSVVLDSGDRLLIGRYLGLTQLGLYAAAYSIATYAEETLMTPVNMALMPAYMKIWIQSGKEKTAEFLTTALDWFVLGCGAIATLVFVNAPDLLAILASRKFSEASKLLPILVVGLLVYAVHIFFNAPLIIHKRSMLLTIVTSVCCVANVLMNMYLLPRIGIIGAAWSTLLSYVLMVGALAVISRRYMVVRFPTGSLASSIVVTLAVHAAMDRLSISSPWISLGVKASAALILYLAGIVIIRPTFRRLLFERVTRQVSSWTAVSEAGQ